ncbi:acyl-CoA dehydrogenase family protein [Nesterenkonia lutea]|uniref:Alkylation response protein AidB-like acyl-CoA dehydrogenase n=1 Tax=Nesterenkonia lutea TaxID=272919 RepID=A0ABR9JDV3_9MICC|nr:acyl-CoA dehydrogenase family protein [Nesterenkonia lutea]MBE1524107.1 alkylation response protein AidB-like acyl-CoA dehydrogenase [Nesterenkonia lutea]
MDPVDTVLSEDLLARISARAPGYDARNEFCHEDLAELTEAGYLRALVPSDRGGLGWDLPTLVAAQRRLAAAAPATALAVNMHHIWVSVARGMVAGGHTEFDQVLTEAAAGEIFAFGISEAGNDAVLFDSTTEAEVDDDGAVTFTGNKIFTTLAPVWTRLGLFGKDTSATGAEGETPLIFGFLERSASGWHTIENWDTLGMRATQSHATALEGARVPAERIVRRLPVGPNPDPLVFAIFSSFLTLLAAVYTGIGDRALVLGAELVAKRTSLISGESMSRDPDVRYKLAEAQLAQLALDSQLRTIAAEVEAGAEHGSSWFPRLATLRTTATRTARQVVDLVLGVSGGAQYHRESELSRLYRDSLAGIHHPSDDESAHRTLANYTLGPL